MSISSDEINLLVQHYLQELGYSHAAFAFGCESKIPLNKISKRHVQPGALVYLIQKGIMFAQMEAAAEKALEEPSSLFAHQLNVLRANLRQSTDLVNELCAATRRMKVFPQGDEVVTNQFILNNQSALFLRAHKSPVLSCVFGPVVAPEATEQRPSMLFMATGSAGGNVVVWRFETQQNGTSVVHHDFTIHRAQVKGNDPLDVTALNWNPNTPILAVGNAAGDVKLYEAGNEIMNVRLAENAENNTPNPVISLKFSNDGTKLLVALARNMVFILKQNEIVSNWDLQGEITDAVWAEDGAVFAASKNTLYKLISISVASENSTILTHKIEPVCAVRDTICQLNANSINQLFSIVDNTGVLTVVDINGNMVFQYQIHHGAICCSSWGSIKMSSFIATGGVDRSIKLVNIKDQNLIEHSILSFDGHSSPVYSLGLDANAKYIVSVAKDVVNVWSLESNKLVISYKSKTKVVSVVWSPNGRFLSICLLSGDVAVIDFDQLE